MAQPAVEIKGALAGAPVPYKAVVLGASGAVGGALVNELLASPKCEHILTVGRRKVDAFEKHPNAVKVQQHIIDVKQLAVVGNLTAEQLADAKTRDEAMKDLPEIIRGHTVAFSTFGVGRPSQTSREEFNEIDIVSNRGFARICKQAGVQHISLLSSVGASKTSGNFYLKAKFESEKGLWENGFERASMFRPSVLITAEKRYGFVDFFNHHIFPVVSCVLPNQYHQVKVVDLAKAMRVNAESAFDPARAPPQSDECNVQGVETLTYNDFMKLISTTQ